MSATHLVPVHGDRSGDPEDMFADLPEIDPFALKKDEVAAQLVALMSFAKKNRSQMAEHLSCKKSRVTNVLSGKGNPTIRTIWDFCGALGYDFDVIFRATHDHRPPQLWQKPENIVGLSDELYLDVTPTRPKVTILAQTPTEVAVDILNGRAKPAYFSVELHQDSAKYLVELERKPEQEQPAISFSPGTSFMIFENATFAIKDDSFIQL